MESVQIAPPSVSSVPVTPRLRAHRHRARWRFNYFWPGQFAGCLWFHPRSSSGSRLFPFQHPSLPLCRGTIANGDTAPHDNHQRLRPPPRPTTHHLQHITPCRIRYRIASSRSALHSSITSHRIAAPRAPESSQQTNPPLHRTPIQPRFEVPVHLPTDKASRTTPGSIFVQSTAKHGIHPVSLASQPSVLLHRLRVTCHRDRAHAATSRVAQDTIRYLTRRLAETQKPPALDSSNLVTWRWAVLELRRN